MASLAFALVLLASALPHHAAAAGKGLSIELIDRDSPKSPLYDPSATRFDRLTAALHRSVAQAHRVSASLAASDGGSIVSKLSPGSGEYLMELLLGTPSTKIIAIADTGSDLIWTNCKPCDQCFSQKPPLFDPSESSTYGEVSCRSDACSALPAQSCGQNSTCEYHYSYGDSSNVDGTLSTETATFNSAAGAKVSVENVEFGCNSQSSGTFKEEMSGLVGLGAGPLSLVSQLSSSFQKKFSYCLVPRSSSSNSKIIFGEDGTASGGNAASSPLKIARTTFYTLNLQEITIGGKSVDVSSVAPVESDSGNIIIDSGTTLTLLDSGVIDELVKALEGEVNLPVVSDPIGAGLGVCYDISKSSTQSTGFPDITFKFDGATVVLKPLNMFIQVDSSTVCLAVAGGSGSLPQILGNIAQQNLNVGYDLVANKISFAPTDCTKA